jgi:hypothetical protein
MLYPAGTPGGVDNRWSLLFGITPGADGGFIARIFLDFYVFYGII